MEQDLRQQVIISIHAPHTRSDIPWLRQVQIKPKFQSTPLIRGATAQTVQMVQTVHFNPRPSYEERPPLILRFR